MPDPDRVARGRCAGCGASIYLSVSDSWQAHGGATGGICHPTSADLNAGVAAYGIRDRPHVLLDLQDPETVNIWLAS